MIGALALNAVRDFFAKQQSLVKIGQDNGKSIKIDENIEGYVRFSTLYLKLHDQSLKISFFQQKNQILHAVNLALKNIWYTTKIEEIRFK